jgi:hypothetical protein
MPENTIPNMPNIPKSYQQIRQRIEAVFAALRRNEAARARLIEEHDRDSKDGFSADSELTHWRNAAACLAEKSELFAEYAILRIEAMKHECNKRTNLLYEMVANFQHEIRVRKEQNACLGKYSAACFDIDDLERLECSWNEHAEAIKRHTIVRNVWSNRIDDYMDQIAELKALRADLDRELTDLGFVPNL